MKIYEAPRISVNKLGEYIYASAARKKKILIEAKFPSEIITARYTPVQNAAIQYFVSPVKDIEVFNRVKQILSEKTTTNDHQKEKVKSCIEALNHLSDCSTSKLVPYAEMHSIKGHRDCKSINIDGVTISLRPEILLLDAITNQPIGAIKLAFAKGHFLSIQEGQCVAGLIKSYLEDSYKIQCHYKNCLTMDVFSERIIYAPTKNGWTIDKIRAACADIRMVWPLLHKKAA